MSHIASIQESMKLSQHVMHITENNICVHKNKKLLDTLKQTDKLSKNNVISKHYMLSRTDMSDCSFCTKYTSLCNGC